MNELEIEALLRSEASVDEQFRGVMPCDVFGDVVRLSSSDGQKGLYVVNTDPSEQKGTHWVGVVIGDDERVFFFDPFGASAEMYPSVYGSIVDRLITSNVYPLQSFDTDVCGDYCSLFVKAVAEKIRPEDFCDYWYGRRDRDYDVRQLVNGMLKRL